MSRRNPFDNNNNDMSINNFSVELAGQDVPLSKDKEEASLSPKALTLPLDLYKKILAIIMASSQVGPRDAIAFAQTCKSFWKAYLSFAPEIHILFMRNALRRNYDYIFMGNFNQTQSTYYALLDLVELCSSISLAHAKTLVSRRETLEVFQKVLKTKILLDQNENQVSVLIMNFFPRISPNLLRKFISSINAIISSEHLSFKETFGFAYQNRVVSPKLFSLAKFILDFFLDKVEQMRPTPQKSGNFDLSLTEHLINEITLFSKESKETIHHYRILILGSLTFSGVGLLLLTTSAPNSGLACTLLGGISFLSLTVVRPLIRNCSPQRISHNMHALCPGNSGEVNEETRLLPAENTEDRLEKGFGALPGI